ncbi:hypothetical protein SAMN05421855_102296 [Ulvibacter litoralis]|uniref:Uncharacterized protein n=1 Tax=Ulvibacter litoralis TaxID=227084 RepID=A0A1G7F3A0_9FLAO|nr:hypothetical protein SAMN05421855_102296 [Ulvibacter litoralis]
MKKILNCWCVRKTESDAITFLKKSIPLATTKLALTNRIYLKNNFKILSHSFKRITPQTNENNTVNRTPVLNCISSIKKEFLSNKTKILTAFSTNNSRIFTNTR